MTDEARPFQVSQTVYASDLDTKPMCNRTCRTTTREGRLLPNAMTCSTRADTCDFGEKIPIKACIWEIG
jgi:hypothetical protein